jgi:hypothetical protein
MEDVLLFEKLIKHESIEVVRAVDPGIYHLWHDKQCSLDQLQGDMSKFYMCR